MFNNELENVFRSTNYKPKSNNNNNINNIENI